MKPNARVVKELLEHGANPAHTDRAGRNCLHHALLRKRRYTLPKARPVQGQECRD
jgi:ankyrin repeat protein